VPDGGAANSIIVDRCDLESPPTRFDETEPADSLLNPRGDRAEEVVVA
jgi:hypothetical protein